LLGIPGNNDFKSKKKDVIQKVLLKKKFTPTGIRATPCLRLSYVTKADDEFMELDQCWQSKHEKWTGFQLYI